MIIELQTEKLPRDTSRFDETFMPIGKVNIIQVQRSRKETHLCQPSLKYPWAR